MNLGDKVRLKSGGPVMTVGTEANEKGNVWCYCFDEREIPQRLQRDSFPIIALEPAKAASPTT